VDIYEAKINRGALEQKKNIIASQRARNSLYRYHPNEDRIAFISNKYGGPSIWVQNNRTQEKIKLAGELDTSISLIEWSPSGNALMYLESTKNGSLLQFINLSSKSTINTHFENFTTASWVDEDTILAVEKNPNGDELVHVNLSTSKKRPIFEGEIFAMSPLSKSNVLIQKTNFGPLFNIHFKEDYTKPSISKISPEIPFGVWSAKDEKIHFLIQKKVASHPELISLGADELSSIKARRLSDIYQGEFLPHSMSKDSSKISYSVLNENHTSLYLLKDPEK